MQTLPVNGYDMAYLEVRPRTAAGLRARLAVRFPHLVLRARPAIAETSRDRGVLAALFPRALGRRQRHLFDRAAREDVIGFIEQLNAGPVDLMGHSRGGHISFRVAQRRPDLLRRLILAEPGGELDATLDPAATPGPSPLAARVAAAAEPDRGRRCRGRANVVLRRDRRPRRLDAAAGDAEAAVTRQCDHA